MIISMPKLVAMLGICHTFLAAGTGTCASSPLTLPSPPAATAWWVERRTKSGGEGRMRAAISASSNPRSNNYLTDCLADSLTDSCAIHLNPKLNPKQDNLCEVLARTA